MTPSGDDDRTRKLDAYLDGLLEAAERDAFERKIASDPKLRVDVERQAIVDASLARLFAAPPGEAVQNPPADDRAHAVGPVSGIEVFEAAAQR